jgi:hypothetical protein
MNGNWADGRCARRIESWKVVLAEWKRNLQLRSSKKDRTVKSTTHFPQEMTNGFSNMRFMAIIIVISRSFGSNTIYNFSIYSFSSGWGSWMNAESHYLSSNSISSVRYPTYNIFFILSEVVTSTKHETYLCIYSIDFFKRNGKQVPMI